MNEENEEMQPVNLMFRCWGVMCHVWYFGGKSRLAVCPGCKHEGTEISPTEQSRIHHIWHNS